MTETIQRLIYSLLAFFFATIANAPPVLGQEATGIDYYKKAIQLSQASDWEGAAPQFWASLIRYDRSSADQYSVSDSMSGFLQCYQNQGKLELGYLFIARSMHRTNDGRAIEYLRSAYQINPHHPEILELMKQMGETTDTIRGKRRYKKAEGGDDTPPSLLHSTSPETCNTMERCSKEAVNGSISLDPGWDEATNRRYSMYKLGLMGGSPIDVTISPLGPFQVAHDVFWAHFQDGKVGWEPETFRVFSKHVNKETVVIDFGTWIGVTMLYHAQLSKLSIGLEADPVAFATVEHNFALNPHLASNVRLSNVAVVAPQHAGVPFPMGSRGAGDSESRFGAEQATDTWNVTGFTLPFILTHYHISLQEQPVFVKMDIETYECTLLPSFHEWLANEATKIGSGRLDFGMFVSFHPQLEPCTKRQMKDVLRVFKLFELVECNSDGRTLPISAETTFEEFEHMLDQADCLTHKDNADFVLSGVKGIESVRKDEFMIVISSCLPCPVSRVLTERPQNHSHPTAQTSFNKIPNTQVVVGWLLTVFFRAKHDS